MKKLLIALTSAVVMLAVSAGTAQAATGRPDFAGQARTAGLTAAQADQLQERADSYLARLGGRRVSLNKIELARGATLVLALPGQDRAREVSASGDVGALLSCPYLYFCAFSGTNYTQDAFFLYNCYRQGMPWAGNGSWSNNQSPGTRARFYNSSGSLIFTTPGAAVSDGVYDWTPVFSIQPC